MKAFPALFGLQLRLGLVIGMLCLGGVLLSIAIGERSDGWTVSYITSPYSRMTLIDTRTRLQIPILPHVDFSETPARSPDGRYIAGRTGDRNLTLFDLDSGAVVMLGDGNLPTWSPLSDRLIYRQGNRLYQSTVEPLTVTPIDVELQRTFGRIDAIKWSPDSGHIALEGIYRFGGETVDYEIYTLRPDGTQVVNISNDATVDDWGASWSPEGERLAFASMRDGNPELYLANFLRGDVTRLTEHSSYDSTPIWSPDGRWLAFLSYRESQTAGLYLLDMQTENVEISAPLAFGLRETAFIWSPQSDEIAYLAIVDGNLGLYVVGLNHEAPKRLLDLSGQRGVTLLP